MDLMRDLPAENKEEIDDSVGIIQLICGEQNHRPFWAYVSMYPSTYLEYLKKVEAHEQVTIDQYGIVIETDWGSVPPLEVQERMKRDYGADNGLQDKLIKMAEEWLAGQDQEETKTIN